MLRRALMGLGIGTVLTLTGCAATGGTPTATKGPSTQAVACSKCEVTYVQVPTQDNKGRFVGYSKRPNMECPDCKTAVQTFFETGKLEHSCAHCSGTMEVCESHT